MNAESDVYAEAAAAATAYAYAHVRFWAAVRAIEQHNRELVTPTGQSGGDDAA
jgi:hypothetical protein